MDQKELIAGFRELAQDPDPEIAAEAVAELKKLGAVDVSGARSDDPRCAVTSTWSRNSSLP